MFWYNVISNNPSYKKKKRRYNLYLKLIKASVELTIALVGKNYPVKWSGCSEPFFEIIA